MEAIIRQQELKRRGLGRMGISVLFLFSPVMSLVVALRNFQIPWSKNLLWAFTVFFGFTFVVSNQMDSTRYSEALHYLNSRSVASLPEFLSLMYDTESGYVDVLSPLLTFLVSRVTDNDRILFAVFGFVFGFFYSRNVWFLLEYAGPKIRREALPFLLLAALTIAIWQINGFRFWTAAHVFIYGLFRFVKGNRLSGLLLAAGSLFVHFSFVFPVSALLVFWIVGNRFIIFTVLYFSSFFLTQVRPEVLESYAGAVPEVFQERTIAYTREEYIKEREELLQGANWYVKWRTLAIHYALNLLLLILLLKYRKAIRANYLVAGLLCYALLLATATNLLSSVPSVLRFQMVSDVLLFSAFFLFVQMQPFRTFPRMAYVAFLAAAALFLIVELRVGFETTSLLTVLGNPLVAPFIPNDIPLISFFK